MVRQCAATDTGERLGDTQNAVDGFSLPRVLEVAEAFASIGDRDETLQVVDGDSTTTTTTSDGRPFGT